MNSVKKIPLRTCIVCKEQRQKAELIRIVRTPEGDIVFDKTGKINGRGAYVCDNPQCINTCLKKRLLNKVFRAEVPQDAYDRLSEEYGKE